MSGPPAPKVKQELIVSVTKDCHFYHDHPRGITPVDNDHPVEYSGDVKGLFNAPGPPFLIRQTRTPRGEAFLTGRKTAQSPPLHQR